METDDAMLTESVLPALIRSALVAATALGAGVAVRAALARTSLPRRTALWALVVMPWLTPSLLTAYAYLPIGIRSMAFPVGHELLYGALLFFRLMPVAVLVLTFCPPRLSREAHHCYRLLPAGSLLQRTGFYLRAVGPGPWAALTLIFLMGFGEFDLASVLGIQTWTVALFDAQTGGFALRETLRLASLPAALSMAVAGCFLLLLSRIHPGTSEHWRPAVGSAWVGWSIAGAGFVVGTLWPVLAVSGQSIEGIAALGRQSALSSGIAVSVLVAGAAAGLAYLATGAVVGRCRALAWPLVAPGLAGSLVVALVVLAVFRWSALRAFYDGPLPLALALAVIVLPFAVILRLALAGLEHGDALHLARLLGSRRLVWELHARKHAVVLFLLFCWGYFDVAASAILAPVAFTPVFVRLHNLMHYGQSAVLSALVLAATAVPVALLAVIGAGAEWYVRGHNRHRHA